MLSKVSYCAHIIYTEWKKESPICTADRILLYPCLMHFVYVCIVARCCFIFRLRLPSAPTFSIPPVALSHTFIDFMHFNLEKYVISSSCIYVWFASILFDDISNMCELYVRCSHRQKKLNQILRKQFNLWAFQQATQLFERTKHSELDWIELLHHQGMIWQLQLKQRSRIGINMNIKLISSVQVIRTRIMG